MLIVNERVAAAVVSLGWVEGRDFLVSAPVPSRRMLGGVELAQPLRDAGMRTELGERACVALMSQDDWRHAIRVGLGQELLGPDPDDELLDEVADGVVFELGLFRHPTKPLELWFDTDDVVAFESPRDAYPVPCGDDGSLHRLLGHAHLHLTFAWGKTPEWREVASPESSPS